MRNPPKMTWPRLVDRPTQDFSPQNLGFLLRHSRLNNGGGHRWQISYTMHDGLDVDKREIRKCKFPPISPPQKSGLPPHIWRLTKNLSESLRAYLSLSVLKITKPGTNLVASVNQRSPHCSEEWWPGGFMGDFIHFISNVHIFLIFWFNGQSNGFFWKLNQMPEKSKDVDQEIHFHSILRLWDGLVWVVEQPFVDRRSRCCFSRCCFNSQQSRCCFNGRILLTQIKRRETQSGSDFDQTGNWKRLHSQAGKRRNTFWGRKIKVRN